MIRPIRSIRPAAIAAVAVALVGCTSPDTADRQSPSGAPPQSEPSAGSQPPTAPAAGPCSNRYQPVVAGAVWTYHTTADLAGTVRSVDLAVETRRVTRRGFLMVTSGSGGSLPVPWRCTRAGLVQAELGNLTPGGPRSLFRVTDVTGLTLPRRQLLGLRWAQSYRLVGSLTSAGQVATYDGMGTIRFRAADATESVEVPAGTYDALPVYADLISHLTLTVGGRRAPFSIEVESRRWYAQAVGLVKEVTDATIGFSHIQISMLLSDVTGIGVSL